MSAMLYRIAKSNGIYNKVLALNSFSTQVVLLITAMSIILDSFFLVDIALLYSSVSFISTVALMRLMLL
ncbi:monovalent cation/H+ antiporter complex subunit F [Wolbachia endosymbiont of Litomosoides sigmodontis]|uniref:monovalent cation/H+ antiporter complex subunit F n=1 Tax=Wolbachia endosymbiont of Litomosoides sigmodontis TaxID=80850 RepID=UPI0034623524